MEENLYWSEETEVAAYTKELQEELGSGEKYRAIFQCFLQKDLYSLAKILTAVVKANRQLADKSARLEKLVQEQSNQIAHLSAQLAVSNGTSMSEDDQRTEVMKALYAGGCSLREIGRRLNCDKATVKRKLLKAGVSFNENSGDGCAPVETDLLNAELSALFE